MKKVLGGMLFFIIVMIISVIIHFPVEKAAQYSMRKAGKKTGMVFQYGKGSFSITGIEMKNFEIYRNKSLLMKLREVNIIPGMGNLAVNCKKNGGEMKVLLSRDKTDFSCKEFHAITDGTKLFKQVVLTGNMKYNNKKKSGNGKFRVNLMESLETTFIPSDIMAITELRMEPEEYTINILSFQGVNSRGSGKIVITPNKKLFKKSKIAGVIKIRTKQMQINLKLSGNLEDPKYVPQYGAK